MKQSDDDKAKALGRTPENIRALVALLNSELTPTFGFALMIAPLDENDRRSPWLFGSFEPDEAITILETMLNRLKELQEKSRQAH